VCLLPRHHDIYGILVDPDKEKINCALRDLQSRFEVQDEGDLSDYLGVKVQKHPDGSIEFTQPQLVDSILDDLRLINHGGSERSKSTNTPCQHDGKMQKDEGGKEFDYSWEYRSVIGKLNYLEKSTIGDLAFSVHQCAWYMAQPMRVHGEAVKRIGRYLLGTRDKGFIIKPDTQQLFECYVDADCCGNWDPIHSEDPNLAKSRTGYLIMYRSVGISVAICVCTQHH
jgi:hypothetical protein